MKPNSTWGVVLVLALTAGCQSLSRPPRAVPMMAAAPLDETPRPKAEAAPRGQPGDGLLSTAHNDLPKKLTGAEEATYEYPVTAPKETINAPKIELPPAPSMAPLTQTPASLPTSSPATPAVPPINVPLTTGAPASTTLPLPPSTTPPVAPTPSAAPATLPAAQPNPPITIIGAAEPKPSAGLAPPVAVEPTPPQTPVATPKPTPVVEATPTSLPKQDETAILPMAPAGRGNLVASLRTLHQRANERFATMDSYTLRLRRREVVGGKSRPEELVLAKFRKAPFSIYLKWVGEEGKNREVCYVQGRYEDSLHTLLAPGDMFLFGGKHMKFSLDHPMVRSNCRYPVSEAGFGPMITRFGKLVDSVEKGDGREGTAKYLGKVKRPEFDLPVEGVVQNLPAKYDSLFPNGGQRYWFFDVTEGLPVLMVTLDHQGKEVEYYCHDRIQAPANLDDDDFNPYRLWKAAAK